MMYWIHWCQRVSAGVTWVCVSVPWPSAADGNWPLMESRQLDQPRGPVSTRRDVTLGSLYLRSERPLRCNITLKGSHDSWGADDESALRDSAASLCLFPALLTYSHRDDGFLPLSCCGTIKVIYTCHERLAVSCICRRLVPVHTELIWTCLLKQIWFCYK